MGVLGDLAWIAEGVSSAIGWLVCSGEFSVRLVSEIRKPPVAEVGGYTYQLVFRA